MPWTPVNRGKKKEGEKGKERKEEEDGREWDTDEEGKGKRREGTREENPRFSPPPPV